MAQPTPTVKRKAIDEYFARSNKRLARKEMLAVRAEHVSVQGHESNTNVPGLQLHEAFVTSAEEEKILAFLNDASRCIWRTDLSRRTMHFGGTYCLFDKSAEAQAKKPDIMQAPPMPTELAWLIDRMVAAGIFLTDRRPQYCKSLTCDYQCWWTLPSVESLLKK